MCYVFTCVTGLVEVLQRCAQFAMAMWLCLVVCLALLVASGLGVAYGYNYSLAEYIYLKPEGQAFYMRRGRLVNERKVPQIQYPNLGYDPRVDRFSEQNANPEGQPGGAPPPPGGVAPLSDDVSTEDPFRKLKMLQMLTTTNKEDLMSDNEGPPFPKFEDDNKDNKETLMPTPTSPPTSKPKNEGSRTTELQAPATLINPLMLRKFKTLGWSDNKIDMNELQDKTETEKGTFDTPVDENLRVRPKEQPDISMYGALQKKGGQKTPDTEFLEDFGVRGLDQPARPAEVASESLGVDNLAVEPIKLTETQERSESHPERTPPTEGQEQEEDQWEPQEAQESPHEPSKSEDSEVSSSSEDSMFMKKFEPVDIFSGTKVNALQRTRGLEVASTYKVAKITTIRNLILLPKLSQ